MAVTTAANQLLKRVGALEANMFIGDPALLVHALSTLEDKLAAPAASSPPAAQDVDEQTWQQCCDEQGWNLDSQVLHLEGFVRERNLMAALGAYARQCAAEENELTGDEDHDGAAAAGPQPRP